MLFREIIAVYCENRTEHESTLNGKNAEFSNVKAGSWYIQLPRYLKGLSNRKSKGTFTFIRNKVRGACTQTHLDETQALVTLQERLMD
jgi:hypothetical protein